MKLRLLQKTIMALCTPDFFGFDADLKLQYRGRLNSAGKNQTSSETKMIWLMQFYR